MGVSRITAYAIATRDDIIITQGGPDENGKFMGWITLGPDDRCRPLLNSEAIYDSAEEAVDAMTKLVEGIKKTVAEETGGKHPIDHVLDSL